ncbi:hypothetical protein BDN72DRAFT_251660 [Pluteus cervinus]|uniref:Uncharacterized protein n=1 Tax=Pluteus cervinus TaxID=181527 RepID=A0ACD3AGR2_9AGAR|nr:hypothetical protein BDN72DRAFT_251660 [Pluteus cervinus]
MAWTRTRGLVLARLALYHHATKGKETQESQPNSPEGEAKELSQQPNSCSTRPGDSEPVLEDEKVSMLVIPWATGSGSSKAPTIPYRLPYSLSVYVYVDIGHRPGDQLYSRYGAYGRPIP